MSWGPQYTRCVEPQDFTTKGLMVAWAVVSALFGASVSIYVILSAVVAGPVVLPAAVAAGLVAALKVILDWTVNGKLICLHRDDDHHCNIGQDEIICAMGMIVDTEDVGQDKNIFEDVDNDYSMNLLLVPMTIGEIYDAVKAAKCTEINVDKLKKCQQSAAYKHVSDMHGRGFYPQAELILYNNELAKVKNLFGKDGITKIGEGFESYFRTVVYNADVKKYKTWTEIAGRNYSGMESAEGDLLDELTIYFSFLAQQGWKKDATDRFGVPVFHCEFEGSRQKDVLDALNTFTLGGSWCKKNIIFGFICSVLSAILAPIAILAALIAWAIAKDGNPADALEGGGSINAGDWVIATGRWVYDGGHQGYNELHATRRVQKVAQNSSPDDVNRWCRLICEIPIAPPGFSLQQPEQELVAKNQAEPHNRYVFHPMIDGCLPSHRANEPTPIIR